MKYRPPYRGFAMALVLTLALASTVVLTGCAAKPKPETATTAAAGEVRTYEVFGMGCPACHGGLEKLAKELPCVDAAKASWQKNRLTLTIDKDAEVTDEAVREAIARANFTAGERTK